MDIMPDTRVSLNGYDLEGWTETPEPHEKAPDVGMVLVAWDGRKTASWEYVEDLTIL